MGSTQQSTPCGMIKSAISSVAAPRKSPAPRLHRRRPPRGSRASSPDEGRLAEDRKSTRLNSSHLGISYAVFCLKKKKHFDLEQTAHASYSGHAVCPYLY